jgi:crotonobetainyl-CoA:carnitine CoA-transferase CaiB-like acyl-CoA transferase
MKGLLENVRVIDLTTYAAGPVCSRILGDWGADVIKIEPLVGDTYRHFGLMMGTPVGEAEDPMFYIDNANKRGIAIDVKAAEGKAIMSKLLDAADVFVTNYRLDAISRMGLTFEELSAKYPRLIYGYINGYGSKGPDASRPGYDFSAYWGRGGLMIELGEPDAPPLSCLAGFGDHPTGTFLAGGIVAALYGREKTGRGEKVEASLYHSAIWNMALNVISSYYWENPRKSRLDPLNPMVNSFQCKDGTWLILIVTPIDHERYWKVFCEALEIPELINDNRFNTFNAAVENKKLLTSIIDDAVKKKDRGEWEKILSKTPIVYERVQNFHDINCDEQAIANNYLEEVTFHNGNKALIPTPPVEFPNMGQQPRKLAPGLGEHTREILSELGFNTKDIEEMERKKIILT